MLRGGVFLVAPRRRCDIKLDDLSRPSFSRGRKRGERPVSFEEDIDIVHFALLGDSLILSNFESFVVVINNTLALLMTR